MPRLIFGQESKQNNALLSSVKQESRTAVRETPADRERILRQKRSKEYIDKLCKLDAGEYHGEHAVEQILDEVRKEFPLIEIPGDFVGYVSKCYLGKEYEVHTVDFAGNIICHYKVNESLPPVMENARYIAMDEHYSMIEVYTGCLRAIHENGDVSVIKF